MVLKDEVVLITGASSGIGRATAEAMARAGARVAVNFCHNEAGAEEVVDAIQRLGKEGLAIRADVTCSAEVEDRVGAIRDRWGRIDTLVNNAGDLIKRTPLPEMTEEYWDQILALNLKSAFLCVKAVWSLNFAFWISIGNPPKTAKGTTFASLEMLLISSTYWSASSRVGTRMRT